MEIRSCREGDAEAVIELWTRCDLVRPWNDPRKDIARKLRVQPELFLIAERERAIVGSVMAAPRRPGADEWSAHGGRAGRAAARS